MREIVKILEEKCDFDDLTIFNCETKIIKPIKRYLEIEWYKHGGQKIAIKFKNNKYIFKIYYEKIYSVWEQELYNLAKALFNSTFYLPIKKISKNYLIFYQEEVKIINSSLVEEYKKKYNINLINNEINLVLSQIQNLNPLDQEIIISENLKLWIYLSIQYYGKEQFIKNFNFYNLPFFNQDFSFQNLGITKLGKPVIIDYY